MLIGSRLKEKVKPFAKKVRGMAQIHRLCILYLLANEPMEVRDITDSLSLPENLIAHHLKQLYISGWVVKTRQGRLVTYKLNEKAFFEFYRMFEDTPFDKQVLSKYRK